MNQLCTCGHEKENHCQKDWNSKCKEFMCPCTSFRPAKPFEANDAMGKLHEEIERIAAQEKVSECCGAKLIQAFAYPNIVELREEHLACEKCGRPYPMSGKGKWVKKPTSSHLKEEPPTEKCECGHELFAHRIIGMGTSTGPCYGCAGYPTKKCSGFCPEKKEKEIQPRSVEVSTCCGVAMRREVSELWFCLKCGGLTQNEHSAHPQPKSEKKIEYLALGDPYQNESNNDAIEDKINEIIDYLNQ